MAETMRKAQKVSWEATFVVVILLAASGTVILGAFTQGPRSFPFDLERVDGEAERPPRPQEPTPPSPLPSPLVVTTEAPSC